MSRGNSFISRNSCITILKSDCILCSFANIYVMVSKKGDLIGTVSAEVFRGLERDGFIKKQDINIDVTLTEGFVISDKNLRIDHKTQLES